MCPSRLPNDETSYRPCGMLDRDQRTAFTINKERCGPTMVLTTSSSSLFCGLKSTSERMLNHQCNSSTSAKCKSIPPPTVKQQADKDLTVGGYKCRCRCDCQQQNSSVTLNLWKKKKNSMVGIYLKRKYTSTGGYYQSRIKFINCLLVFICIWFTTIHHTFAYPLSQADMLDVNHPEAQTCEKIKDALSKPEYQTRLALSYIRNLVDNYTKAQFNKQSHEVHELWRKHAAHFYNGMERDFLPENFDGELEPQYTEHLNREDVPSPDELSMELQRIYGHLQILNKVFNIIKEDRLVNEHEIMHQPVKDDPKELYKIVNELFWEQARYSHLDIDEIETAMHALGIIPIKVEDIVIDKKDRVLAEWLATREYLKVLRYMHGVYKILIKRCS